MNPHEDSASDSEEEVPESLANATLEELVKYDRKVYLKNKKLASSSTDNEQSSYRNHNKSPFAKKSKTSKDAPIETSSRRVDKGLNFLNIVKPHEKKKNNPTFRDPRFDNSLGDYKPRYFEQNYSFINELRQKEIDELRKGLKKAKDPETREQLHNAIRRLENQINNQQNKTVQNDVKKRIKMQVQQKAEVPKPENTFVNKTTLKRAQLVEKYKQLKESGKFTKYLEKKRKKNVSKDRKKITTRQ